MRMVCSLACSLATAARPTERASSSHAWTSDGRLHAAGAAAAGGSLSACLCASADGSGCACVCLCVCALVCTSNIRTLLPPRQCDWLCDWPSLALACCCCRQMNARKSEPRKFKSELEPPNQVAMVHTNRCCDDKSANLRTNSPIKM